MKWRHIDLKLDAHKNHVLEYARGQRESEKPKQVPIQKCYQEEVNLSFGSKNSGVMDLHERREADNNVSARPSQVSNNVDKKKMDYLEKKRENHLRQIALLKMKLKLHNQLEELKKMESTETVRPDANLNPTKKEAAKLAM